MSWPAAGATFRLSAGVCGVLLLGMLLTGCTSRRAPVAPGAEPPGERDLRALAPPQAASAPGSQSEFAAGARILAGFDYLPERQACQRGDRLLWGIRLEKGGRCRIWYVQIRVLQTGVQPGACVSLEAPECEPDLSATGDVDTAPGRSPDRSPADGSSVSQIPAQTTGERTLVAAAPAELPSGWVAEEGPDLLYALLRIDVYDEHASAMASTHQFLSQNFADASLFQGCAIALRCAAAREEPSGSDIQQVSLSLCSFFAMGRLLCATPHIGEIMGEISPQPSLISILVHGGVRVDLGMQCHQATAADRDWPALADGRCAFRLPFEIGFNGEPALRCCVIAAESHPPLRLCSGIVGLEGTNVRKPENRFSVRLLAARLSGGAAQAE